VVKQYSQSTFIDLTWGGLFRSLRDLLIDAKLYFTNKLFLGNNLLINDYTAAL